MKKIIEKNRQLGYDTKWEIACFYADNPQFPIEIYEYDIEESQSFFFKLGLLVYNNDYDSIEISLIAQDEDGSNECCDLLKTIQITKEYNNE
jgi:hypothetical protein